MSNALEQDISTFWSILFSIIPDVEKRLSDHMASHGLTPPQFFVLKTLMEHNGQCPIGQIAKEHHLTNATMTGLVKRMEAMKLVARERSPKDGRSVNVILTENGKVRFDAIKDAVFAQLQVILGLMNPEERQALMHFLMRYVEVMNQVFPIDQVTSGDE